MSCDKCGGMNAEEVLLFGVYGANICTECKNNWTIYIREHELFERSEINKAKQTAVEIAYQGNDDYEKTATLLGLLVGEENALETQIFLSARDWVNG